MAKRLPLPRPVGSPYSGGVPRAGGILLGSGAAPGLVGCPRQVGFSWAGGLPLGKRGPPGKVGSLGLVGGGSGRKNCPLALAGSP
jgi:hypothetical protein